MSLLALTWASSGSPPPTPTPPPATPRVASALTAPEVRTRRLLFEDWPEIEPAPSSPPPDLLIAVDEPGAVVVLERRLTNRSKRIYLTVWSDAVVVVNGERR